MFSGGGVAFLVFLVVMFKIAPNHTAEVLSSASQLKSYRPEIKAAQGAQSKRNVQETALSHSIQEMIETDKRCQRKKRHMT